jgi:hypothetical protein
MITYNELLEKENKEKQEINKKVQEELDKLSQNFTLNYTPIIGGITTFLYENRDKAKVIALQAGWEINIEEKTDKTGYWYELDYKPINKENNK